MTQVSTDLSFEIRFFTAQNCSPVDKIIFSDAHARVLSEIRKEKFRMKAGYFQKPGGLDLVL